MTDKDKAQAYDNLRKALGYVQNGTDTSVRICQDDATRSFVVRVGKNCPKAYVSDSLFGALQEAGADAE